MTYKLSPCPPTEGLTTLCYLPFSGVTSVQKATLLGNKND